MKGILKKVLMVLLVVILGLVIIFWGKIESSFRVYSMLSDVTQYLDEGKDSYNFLISGTYKMGKSTDSIRAAVSYNRGANFQADIKYNQKHYLVTSKDETTNVLMGPSNLIISGNGSDPGNFDLLKLLGDILKSYPQTSKIPTLTFLQKAGISGSVCQFLSKRRRKER